MKETDALRVFVLIFESLVQNLVIVAWMRCGLKMHLEKGIHNVISTSMRFGQRSFDWEERREGGGSGRDYIHDYTGNQITTEIPPNASITAENHNLNFA